MTSRTTSREATRRRTTTTAHAPEETVATGHTPGETATTGHDPGESATARPGAAPEKAAPEQATSGKAATGPDAGHHPHRSDADSMAVWSFVLGLVGLLVFNLVLGPVALTLAALALRRNTTRRARAALGLTLGAADLIVLAALATTDHTLSWSLAT
ncbi:hypothetical protein [Streptomyces albireticuli]|nr:hypothetical protein [Streptomyces albireticuli]MCD9144406.1 hypothetical protein [Streptomyces albireticuli]MCD9163531.1 hypothetical protein [Streptomyces albireticuli]MCD9193083.1 hypothetical protein [Streptomyces albireticuli]